MNKVVGRIYFSLSKTHLWHRINKCPVSLLLLSQGGLAGRHEGVHVDQRVGEGGIGAGGQQQRHHWPRGRHQRGRSGGGRGEAGLVPGVHLGLLSGPGGGGGGGRSAGLRRILGRAGHLVVADNGRLWLMTWWSNDDRLRRVRDGNLTSTFWRICGWCFFLSHVKCALSSKKIILELESIGSSIEVKWWLLERSNH